MVYLLILIIYCIFNTNVCFERLNKLQNESKGSIGNTVTPKLHSAFFYNTQSEISLLFLVIRKSSILIALLK